MTQPLLALVVKVAKLCDDIGAEYALGGSLAASFFGEPRSTADADLAIVLDPRSGPRLVEALAEDLYVPVQDALDAVTDGRSFNAIDTTLGLKIDVFKLGDGLLDRRQIERRVLVPWPDLEPGLWVTSPEDQVLRKLDWYRAGGSASDRQWHDVLGLLRVGVDALDLGYLRETASQLGLASHLDRALMDAGQ